MTAPLLVTSALPYANGSIHLGHLVENIQSDIWVRFQRLIGRDVLFVCAADTHGTPIEVNARKLGLAPADMVERFRTEHERDLRAFGISFDTYDSTNSPENQKYAERVFGALKQGGHVFEQAVEQLFDEEAGRFLPDRFVKGTCPKCATKDQYGDVCENCGATYQPTELKDPYSTISGNKPVLRSSTHFFVKLGSFAPFLDYFAKRLQPEVRNYVQRWIDDGLKDWCVSRDGPYFGFRIPGTEKYFYVWLDAPVGYVSATARLAAARGFAADKYWPGIGKRPRDNVRAEVVHFIGKDIIYFHTLFWPAMLEAAGFALPSKIHVHGMLNIGGAKMSKSRGRMISARDWLDAFDPAYLRYYLAANLGPNLDDIDFSTEELRNRCNSGLINNVGNLVNRALSFTATRFEGQLTTPSPLGDAQPQIDAWIAGAREAFQTLNYREAVKNIEALGSWANEFLQNTAQPWKTIKTDPARAQADLTLVANIAKVLGTLLFPIVPSFATKIFEQLGIEPQDWDHGVAFDLANRKIGTPAPLLTPLEQEGLDKLFAAPETAAPPAAIAPAAPKAPEKQAESGPVSFDDFMKVELRAGKILTAEIVPKSDKMLILTVDVGEPQPRTIGAGIAKAYAPEELVGKTVAIVANLAPRPMKIGKTEFISQGMVLAAAGGPKGLNALVLPDDVAPGTRIK